MSETNGHAGIGLHFPQSGSYCRSTDLSAPVLAADRFGEVIRETITWWNAGQDPLVVNTSGSTGRPKEITFTRAQVEASILRTAHALDLRTASKALLCIDPRYIGGKMMILRSLMLGMDLYCIEPTSDPLANVALPMIDLAAMVPLQVENILQHPSSAGSFARIRKVIIGGAAINPLLEDALRGLGNQVWQTYGMTETLSHIAIRNLSKGESEYSTLTGINISRDGRGCLVAGVPELPEPVITNDLIEITSPGRFRWLGRKDLVINSGGIKLITEELESRIGKVINDWTGVNGYFIAGQPDQKLGEHVTLVLEGDISGIPERARLMNDLSGVLGRFELPREIRVTERFMKTGGGKIDRQASLLNSTLLF